MAKSSPDRSEWELTEEADRDRIGGGPGASDSNSGGGNASGAPDADTAMRAGEEINAGDVDEDKKRLFPEAFGEEGHPGDDRDPDQTDHRE
jgi:hypothetical protein